MNIFILSNDPTGYGFEFVEELIIFTSKFLALLEFVIYDDRITSDFVFDIYWKLLFRFGLGIYLLIVFLSFKLLVVNLTKFCIKKDYKGLLKMFKIRGSVPSYSFNRKERKSLRKNAKNSANLVMSTHSFKS